MGILGFLIRGIWDVIKFHIRYGSRSSAEALRVHVFTQSRLQFLVFHVFNTQFLYVVDIFTLNSHENLTLLFQCYIVAFQVTIQSS